MARVPENILRFARRLRANQTDAEARMWYLLRDRRFGGFKFRRQCPVERFILDFYCERRRLAIEIDGGGHNASLQSLRDAGREKLLSEEGITVLRFWNSDVLTNTEGVLEVIWGALAQGDSAPHPDPLPKRGEGT